MRNVFCFLITMMIIIQSAVPLAFAEGSDIVTVTGSKGSEEELSTTLDNNTDTYWSDESEQAYIDYEFADVTHLTSVGIKWAEADTGAQFTLEYSPGIAEDTITYTTIYNGTSNGSSDISVYSFNAVGAKNLRISAAGPAGLSIADIEFNVSVTNVQTDPYEDNIYSVKRELSPDIIGTKYEKALSLLNKAEIMKALPDENFEPNSVIARKDYLRILTSALGLTGTEDNGNIDGIAPVYPFGFEFIRGTEENGSDTTVSYYEAAKWALILLGYSARAELYGGDKDGYWSCALRIELLEQIDISSRDAALTKGDAAILVYNLLHSEIYESTLSLYDHEVKFMEKYLGLYYENKGRIVRNDFSGIYDSRCTKNGYVQIDNDDELYKTGDTNARALLGYYIEYYYYKNVDTEPELLLIDINNNANNVVSIPYDSLKSYSNNVIKYVKKSNDSQKTVNAKLTEDYSVICNGIYDGEFNLDDIDSVFASRNSEGVVTPKDGIITLMGDNSGKFDTVFVSAYEDYIVDAVNIKNNIITGMTEPNTTLDLRNVNIDEDCYIHKNGEAVSLSDIKKQDVLSVMKTQDDKYEIIVSTQKVRGTIEQVDSSGIRINNTDYICTDLLLRRIQLSPGDAGVFYINFMGKITGAIRQSAFNVGVIIRCFEDDGGGYEYGGASILTSDGTVEIFPFAGKVNITDKNGEKQTVNGDLAASGFVNNDSADYSQRLVRYGLNNNGEINTLDDAAVGSLYDKYSGDFANPNGSQLIEIADSRKMGYPDKDMFIFKVSSYSFGVPEVGINLFYAADDTVVFWINDTKDYKVTDITKLRDSAKYDMIAYAVDDSPTAQYIVVRERPPLMPTMHATSVPLLITGFSHVVDEDGDIKIEMQALREGSKVSYILKDERVITNRITPTEANGDKYYRVTNARDGNYDVGFAMSTEIGLAMTKYDMLEYARTSDDAKNQNHPMYIDNYLPKVHGNIQKTRVLPGDVVHVVLDPYTNEVTGMTVTFDGSRPRTAVNESTGLKMDYQAKGLFWIDAFWDADQSLGFNAGNQRVFGKVISKTGNFIVLETNYSLRRQQAVYVPYDIGGAKLVRCSVQSIPVDSYTYIDENGDEVTVNGGELTHQIRLGQGPGNSESTTDTEILEYKTTVVGSSSVKGYEKILPEDLMIGDEVFMRVSGGDVKDLIVYEWE